MLEHCYALPLRRELNRLSVPGSASLWSPRVLRAAMGAHFSLHTYENIESKTF